MCVTSLSGRGVSTENILDFLSIVAEEVDTADLLGQNRWVFGCLIHVDIDDGIKDADAADTVGLSAYGGPSHY
jgi:hypothetical protein